MEKCSLRELLAKASPLRSGDVLAGIAAENEEERIRAQMALADVPLKRFLSECVVPYETDEVTRLIMDSHDAQAFAPVSSFTVGQLRDWLLTPAADTATLTALAPGLTPEMMAAASKLMRIQDLVLVASKCSVVTRFRDTIGLPGRFSSRLQPNHPTDDARGVLASVIDGLQYGSGDAVIGINPASDSLPAIGRLLRLLDDVIARYGIPTQSCVLTHVTNTLEMIRRGVPVDLCFQSIAGTEKANASFGISLSLLDEAWDATLSLKRGTVGDNVMYFETGQGSALSAGAHFGVDQQTLECRAYAVARRYRPLLVNTVVGFIGPEYLFNGKQIIRAGLEDHCCGKLLGLPMGEDVCYTNHAEADQDDMDMLLTLLGVAGCNFVMGIPGADDIMLGYQSTSFHDVAWLRRVLDAWMDAHPGSAPDVSVVICDGLSARAVHENAVPFASRFLEEAAAAGLSAAPVALVKFGRVAVGDDVAALLNARLVVVLVGERPGLSSPNSLGVYMTHAPTPGLTDEARNCISNVRAAGLPVEEAVRKLCYLVENALVRRLSGVDLKDDVPPGYLPFAETRALG
nr:ethanolamine ammonia-lyase [Desulfovibrio piger]